MPELPDLEIISRRLSAQITGLEITRAEVRRPLVVRNLLDGDPSSHLVGRTITHISRRAKFLRFDLGPDLYFVIHPMLAGRLHYGPPPKKRRKRDAWVLTFENDLELCYNDTKDMGKVYLTRSLEQIPGWMGLGPDATDPTLTLEVFAQGWRKRRGEVKRSLTTQTFVAGIGSAYADEICWQAGIYPFRRSRDLSDEKVGALYEAMKTVLSEAIDTLDTRIDQKLGGEIRDFLSVHGKPGQPCPRCGSTISEVKKERRATHFCRTCQPGLLIGR